MSKKSKYFEVARKLVDQNPLPDDIVEQLDRLYDLVEPEEIDSFLYFYERISLEINLADED